MTTEALVDEPIGPPLQFGLRELLLLQGIAAAFFGLLVVMGVFAVLVAFVAAGVYAAVAVSPAHRPLKRVILEATYGLVLPALCVYFDPGFLRSGNLFDLNLLSIAFQMLLFAVSLVAGRRLGPWAGLLSGALSIGVLNASVIGIILFPVSLIGISVMGIGLLGFTPFLTAPVFARRAVDAYRQCRASSSVYWSTISLWIGGLFALAVPAFLYWMLGNSAVAWIPTAGDWFDKVHP